MLVGDAPLLETQRHGHHQGNSTAAHPPPVGQVTAFAKPRDCLRTITAAYVRNWIEHPATNTDLVVEPSAADAIDAHAPAAPVTQLGPAHHGITPLSVE